MNLTNFDPAQYKFDLPLINTKLSHLFVLAATHDHELSPAVQIQHILTCYSACPSRQFDDGMLTNSQALMNDASIKYAKISTSTADFHGSGRTIREYIVAMVGSIKKCMAAPSGAASAARFFSDIYRARLTKIFLY